MIVVCVLLFLLVTVWNITIRDESEIVFTSVLQNVGFFSSLSFRVAPTSFVYDGYTVYDM